MAGGLGTRFWPLSRAAMPKQFMDLNHSGRTFLRRTYNRMSRTIAPENIIIITLTRYKEIVMEMLPEVPEENILLETYNRNTAPCLANAAYSILKRDPEAVMVATPSDHIITNEDVFDKTICAALDYAANNRNLCTLGILPTRPDTNFGYIQMTGGPFVVDGKPVKIKTFTEKPDIEMAQTFIQTGEFLWNSGIFVWKADVLWEELRKYLPEVTRMWESGMEMEQIYRECPRISIDYAVMEKTDLAMVFPSRFGWADIGNWDSLYEYISSVDEQGNSQSAFGKRLLKDTKKSIVYSTKADKLMAIRGLEDMIVVDTDDVLLICPRDDAKVKDFLSELALPEYEQYR